jgi:hypothetical protein
MFLDFVRYEGATCTADTAIVYIHAEGFFNDLGPVSAENEGMRKFSFNFSLAYAEPKSQTGVQTMAALCPCNGTDPDSPVAWRVNETKILATCDPEDCDISFFGGTDERFDQPNFGIINVSADGGFQLGLFDIDPTIGFANQANYISYTSAEATCSSTSSNNLCGAFSTIGGLGEACEVILNPWTNIVVGSKKANFTYRGAPTEDLIVGQFGVYTRQVQYFSDSSCINLEATVNEQGSMGYNREDTNNGLLIVTRSPANLVVKPASSARGWGSVANLSNHCGCGGGSAWVAGRDRIITTCPEGTCETPIFNDFNAVGLDTYAYVARNTTTLQGENQNFIAFGSWNESSTGLGSSGLKYAMMDVSADSGKLNYCQSGSFSSSLCGTYMTGCAVSPTELDVTIEMTLSGITTNQSSEGKITYAQGLFNDTGGGCAEADMVYDIKGTGFFSQDSNANVVDVVGLVSVDIDFTSFTIKPITPAATDLINDAGTGCPCGGTWTMGQARTLYSCPSGSCSDVWTSAILPGGAFGQAGFGVAQFNTVDRILRVSQLDTSRDAGYARQFDDSVYLMNQVYSCPAATHPADFAGCWELPCHRVDAGSSTPYAMSGQIDLTTPTESEAAGLTGSDESGASNGVFFLNRSVFAASSGCEGSDTKLVHVSAEGSYSRVQSSPSVTGGSVTSLNIFYVTVTPINSAGAAALRSECPTCHETWTAGRGVTFNATACDCAFLTTVAGIPIQGGQAYGVAKVWDYSSVVKVDDAFRMTTFTRDAASVSTATFTRANGEYARAVSAECPYNPAPAPGPNPGPNSGGSSGGSGGLAGGDIFILLVFLSATVYFGGGMVFNYQRTGGRKNGGTPVIPHVTFWRALPGLVSDGFRFVFVERFGTARGGGGPNYEAFGGPSSDSTSGYGAL